MTTTTEFEESSGHTRTQQVPYSHLSVELDHLYMEDLLGEASNLDERMARVRPWYDAIVASAAGTGGNGNGNATSGDGTSGDGTPPEAQKRPKPRVSTCVLIDDYFSTLVSPAEVLPRLGEAARRAGLRIDYLARESCCAAYEGISPAELAMHRLVATPVPGTDGSRPPTLETGWLSNGRRSPDQSRRSMQPSQNWLPPVEANARRHSVFVDVELWDEVDRKRVWSCAMLAAVWQLLRLGLLRDHGRAPAAPQPWAEGEPLPDRWDDLPAVLQLEPGAPAFTAYRTASILDHRFMPVEHAVRVILSQVSQDPDALDLLERRAAGEGLRPVDDVLGRIGYVFLPDREY
ncbi:MAG TPA: SCO2522 family protein [Actinospica sp.]|nr:SCO2522 family protein [Actinospica sp.]